MIIMKRPQYEAAFKAKVTRGATKGEKTMAQIASASKWGRASAISL